jgi:hypothetical protein
MTVLFMRIEGHLPFFSVNVVWVDFVSLTLIFHLIKYLNTRQAQIYDLNKMYVEDKIIGTLIV